MRCDSAYKMIMSAPVTTGEELTISYGDKLWFKDAGAAALAEENTMHDHLDDPDQFLAALQL